MSLRMRALALMDLVHHYYKSAAYHWRLQSSSQSKSYTAAEAEFLPACLSLIEKPVSPTARITALLLVSLVALGLLWAVWGRIDIVVTAEGKIIPSSRTKAIASVDVASVRAIYVSEGQKVRTGDLLLELDAGEYEAQERRATADMVAAQLEMARAKAMLTAIDTHRPPALQQVTGAPEERSAQTRSHLTGQYLDYLAKLAQLDGEIARYSKALPLAQERERSFAQLARTHDVAANAWSEKLQSAIDLEGQLAQARNARLSLVTQTRREALEQLTEAEKIIATATQDAARAHAHARLMSLRAPVEGFVQQLAVHTIGGVVPAAQPLMLIVPKQDRVEVESYVANKDIGFIREGQPTETKITAFDYTRHGTIHGRVTVVSRDAVDDERRGLLYKVNVSLSRPAILVDGSPMALAPGMTVQVEIKTGTRRVIEYLLSPLLRYQHESLNER